MSEARFISEHSDLSPTWCRVSDLADLVEIFEPDVQVCTWQREIDPSINAYLNIMNESSEVQAIEVLPSTALPKLECLPIGFGRDSLIKDLSFMHEVIHELLGCNEVGMRFARLRHAMCPGWHYDRLGIRLICTYQGPGTQWLVDQKIDRSDLGSNRNSLLSYVESAVGEVVLLKGSLWQGNASFGAIHRSPELPANAALRTLVTFDPLWGH